MYGGTVISVQMFELSQHCSFNERTAMTKRYELPFANCVSMLERIAFTILCLQLHINGPTQYAFMTESHPNQNAGAYPVGNTGDFQAGRQPSRSEKG